MNARIRGKLFACAVAAATATLFAFELDARAQTGEVSGSVKLPDPSSRGEPPERNRGFLPRLSNPIIAPVKYDPLPWLVVVLEPKDELTPDQKEPPKVPSTYALIGESFATPIFPVAAGGEVSIKNKSETARRLFSPTDSGLLDGDTINPGGDRVAKLATPYKVVRLRDSDSPHLSGSLVAFPLRYFSLVDDNGRFKIDDVPPGRWQVRLWYQNGWLKMKKETVTVSAKRTSKVDLDMPAIIEVKVPGAGGEGE